MNMTSHIQILARQIGFSLPDAYNASRLLWDNLEANGERPAVLSDAGAVTYRELVAEGARI
ncbi:MAG: hypothetical protein VX749_03885, partial [Pseudomonadota bacterium]|nr:hypothetical protein [Pseudomonadota bacterium]